MALGGSSLGTLTLYINADTADFDQAISRIEQKARAFGSRFSQVEQQLDLTPHVDDSQLTALNKHLNLKQQHFAQVNRFMQSTPLRPGVQTSELQELKAELKEIANLQRETARQFESNPISMPRITIAPRISNRTVNEAPRVNTRVNFPDVRVAGTIAPKVSVPNRLSGNISAAQGASAAPRQLKTELKQVESQIQQINQTELKPQLDIEAIERFTKRIAQLEAQLDRVNEEQKRNLKKQESTSVVGKAVGEAAAKALPNAAEKVAEGVGSGISQGLSQAIPVFAGKMGDAAASALGSAVAKAFTPQIKINTPELKFQTSFTDIVRAGKELVGATKELKDTTKEVAKRDEKPNPVMGFLGRVTGSIFTGVGQSLGGRISTGIMSGIENKLDIKFRDAAESAVVVLADGLEDVLGIQFKQVGQYVREAAPAVFATGAGKKQTRGSAQTNTNQPTVSIEDAVSYLSSQDDGAIAADRKGFNKQDTRRGQKLAEKITAGHKLTQKEAKVALNMLQKYRKQLANAGKGVLPEWEQIEQSYTQEIQSAVAQVQQTQAQASDVDESELLAQLDVLKAQLRAVDTGESLPEQIQQQVVAIQKAEAQVQQTIDDKREDLIQAMMISRDITMTMLKPLGKRMGLPNTEMPRAQGGYSKEELIREIVGKAPNTDELRKELPFMVIPPPRDVVKESEARSTQSPERLKETLVDRRKAIAQSLAQNKGTKSSADVSNINNEIQKEILITNNLLSRDLNNTATRYLKSQRKALTAMSGQLLKETMATSTVAPNVAPATQVGATDDIGDPWLDVDQMRSQAAGVRNAFEIIGDAIGAFVDGIGDYSSKISAAFKSILDGIGGVLNGFNPFGQGSGNSYEDTTPDTGYIPIDPKEGVPKGVEVKEKEKRRDYEFKTKSGKTVKVSLKDEGKKESEVSFSVDGSFGNKSEAMSQKERDAVSLKIFKILKHDAKTRKDGHKYRGVAYDLDGYGAARAYAYQKVGNFTRPVRGVVGMSQYAVTREGKINPDEARLKHEERHISPAAIAANIAKAEDRMKRERERQKARNESASASQASTSVDPMRSSAIMARNALEILGDTLTDFSIKVTSIAQTVKDSFGNLLGGGQKQKQPSQQSYEDILERLTSQAAKKSGIQVRPGQTPKLEFNDEHLKRIGARAQYNIKDNKLIVSSDVKRFFDALKSGAVNLNRYEQEIKDVVHEIRHAFQYDFGKLNQGSLMAGAKPGAMTPFSQTSKSAQQYGSNEAGADYYKQFAAQMESPQAFLDIIRDTEADAENFAESWKEIVQGAFDIDEESLHDDAKAAVQSFFDGLMAPVMQQKPIKKVTTATGVSVAQRRGVSGAVGANPDLKRNLDSALDAFNSTFDVLKGFHTAIGGAVTVGGNSLDETLNSMRRAIEDVEAQINHGADQLTQQGAAQTVDALDKLGEQLDAEVENVEKFIAYVRRKTGGRADPALDQVQSGFRSKVAGVQQNIATARNNAAIQAGLIQPRVAAPPQQLNTWQRILKNIREEIEAINNGEDIKVRFAKGAAADLGVDLSDDQAASLAGNAGSAIGRAKQAPGLVQAAMKGNWTDIFEELLDEIDEFTDAALDRFADFVEGIPGGNVFARVIRGAKEFKGVIFGFVGLQMAFQGLVQVKQWLDGFDEVFVDAAVGWERFEKLIGFSSKTFNQAQSNIKFVRDEAIRLRTDLKQSMQGFSQISAASIDTSLEGTGTKQIFKGLNQAGAAYGLDSEGQNRIFTATSQMISKGTVSSEELKQQLGEVLPGAFQMAARAAGKTTQEFTQLLETGQILSEDFLPKFAQQLGAETAVGVAGAAGTAQGATNRLNNSLLELQVSLGKFGMDERNIVLNAMATMMDFAAKNAVVLSYAMGSLLAGALITSGQALWVFVKRLVVAGANFLMTRLGITSLGLSIKTLGATIRAAASSFLILTIVMESIAMISAAMKDSSGKSREFANTMKGAFKETQRSIAEARGELEKFNAEQDKKDGKKGTGKVVKQGQDSLLDEAPLLNFILKKDVKDNDGWFDKLRFEARQTAAGALDGITTLLNPGAAIESVRQNDRTLVPTYANKKFQDTKRSTEEILDVSRKTAATSKTALGDKELLQVKQYDEQLRQIQLKRRGIVQMNPGDKKGLNELKKQEEEVLAGREKAYKPLAGMQATNQVSIQALESEIEVYKEKIKAAEDDVKTAANGSDRADIQARLDYYKKTLPQLEDSLKGVQDAQDNLSKSIGESVDKFILLQKQLQNVADRLADANDSIQMAGNSAKSQISQGVASGQITAGQAEFGRQKIDQATLQEQLNRKRGAINEYQGLLYGADAQEILESRGVKDIKDVGQAQLGTLAAKAKEGTPEKEVFTRLQEMKKLELESSELTAQLEASKEQTAQQIRDANKQISDYFRDIGRQSAELALTTKEAQAQIALQQQKNKLKSALQGFQDNFFSSFVDSLIEGMDSLNEPLSASIEKEREIQQANFSAQDRNRQTADLYKSLPLETQQIKIDFSAIDSAPVKQLQTSLQESAKASKTVTDATKQTGAAISDSAGDAKDLQGAVKGVGNETEGVKSATENVGSALQDTTSKAQDVNSQLQINKDTIDTNRVATEEVGAAIDVQVAKTGEAITATANSEAATKLLQEAWAYVTTGVADTAAKTWEWFQGLGKNIPFLNQFGEMIGGWGKNIQDLIGKTWEWLQGLGKNIPFLQQIGQTISGWGQNLQQLGQQAGDMAGNVIEQGKNLVGQGIDAARGMLGGGANPGQPVFPIAGVSLEQAESKKTSPWGMRRHPVTGQMKMHRGQDYGFKEGTQVVSPTAGVVTKVAFQAGGAGKYVVVESLDEQGRKVEHKFFHLSSFDVKQGDKVQAGGKVGKVGSTGIGTGAHLHYEAWINGKNSDPLAYLRGKSGKGRLTKAQTDMLGGHSLGDGHNHFGEDDIKQANQKQAQTISGNAGASGSGSVSMGRGGAPKLGQGYDALNELGGQLAQNKYFNPSDPAGRGRLAIALGIGGSEAFEKNTKRRAFYTYKGGTGNNMQGFGQFNNAYHKEIINTPEKYQNFFGQILKGERRLPNSQKGIGDYGAVVTKAVQSGQIKNGADLIRWMQANKLGGSNWQGVDDGWKRNPGLADQLVRYIAGSGATQSTGSMPAQVSASFSQSTSQAQAAQQPMPTLQPVPFASMAGGSGVQSYSSTSVDTKPLQAAQNKSDEIRRVQEKNALDKERARVEQSKVDGEQRQRQRLEQLRQSLRETEGDRVQSNRQFRDLGLDIGEQTPEREAQRKKIGVGDTYDDLEKDVQEKIRKATAGREQASATLKKLSSGEFTPQPGQNVQKDIEAAKLAISTADKYLGDLKKIQGELKAQRESRIRFEEEQSAREANLRKQQEAFATEEINISVLEAEAEKLKGMQGRGIRDQGVENLPKLEATIAARREEISLKQKLSEIDENARKNGTDPKVVGEQKKGLQERLEIVKKTIAENQKYAEQIAGRENAKIDRENRNAQIQQEVELQKQLLGKLEQIAQVNPNAEGVDQIPKLREEIALKELDLKLTNDLAALDEERFGNKINSAQYDERLAAIQKTNAAEKENLALQRQQAETQASIARKRETFEFKSQGAELQGQVSEALAKNIELGRSKGDPTAMRFATQKQQQELSFERQMLELDELESSGKRTKEEIDGLRKAYTQLNEVSLENLRAEQQRATEDRFMEISGRFSQSRGSVLSGKADLLSGMGLDSQAKEYRRVGAIEDQKQSYSQQSLELERFIAQMGLSSEKALELRTNLSSINTMKLDQIDQEFSTLNELMTGVQGSFESAFTSILDGSKSIGEAALDFIKSIGSQLAQMASKLITDQIFGKIMGKGNEKDAAKDASAIAKGGIFGQMTGGTNNPLATYSFANPLPVSVTNTGAMGGMGGGTSTLGGFASGDDFMGNIFGGKGGGFFGENLFGNSPLPVNMVEANDNVFSSLTNGIMGIFGGSGGSAGGLGGLLSGAMSLFGGGGGGASGGGGMSGLLGFGMNLLMGGGFAKGGMIGDPAHIQAYASGGSVGGCGCSACRYARGGMVKGGHSEMNAKVADGLKRESAMTGRRSRLIIASEGEFIIPNKVASRLTKNEQNYLLGKAPKTGSLPSYAQGGYIGANAGDNISSNVTNLGGSTNIGGSTVNVNGDGGGQMTPQEAKAMQAMIDARVMDVVSKQKRARGLLAR